MKKKNIGAKAELSDCFDETRSQFVHLQEYSLSYSNSSVAICFDFVLEEFFSLVSDLVKLDLFKQMANLSLAAWPFSMALVKGANSKHVRVKDRHAGKKEYKSLPPPTPHPLYL